MGSLITLPQSAKPQWMPWCTHHVAYVLNRNPFGSVTYLVMSEIQYLEEGTPHAAGPKIRHTRGSNFERESGKAHDNLKFNDAHTREAR